MLDTYVRDIYTYIVFYPIKPGPYNVCSEFIKYLLILFLKLYASISAEVRCFNIHFPGK